MLSLFESKVKIFQDSSDMGMAEPESLEKRVKKQKIMGGIRTYNLLVTRQTP